MSVLAILAVDPARSIHWLFPETKEIIFGGLATTIIVAALVKFGGPPIKKGMAARTARIQADLDASAAARGEAEAESTEIRRALGDIDAERSRLVGDAEAQAAIVLAEGRARLDQEVAEMEARAVVDAETQLGRGLDELRGEIVLRAGDVVERLAADTLDDSVHQRLIEDFITNVGASSGDAR